MTSAVKYAKSGDVHIAYRTYGDGPHDLVLIPGTISHAELYWEFPAMEYLLQRLTSFARVIVFDKRGQGLSDRVSSPTLEERMDDIRVVMDAVGSSRAAIFGWSEGGSMSLLFAATYPERTTSLVLCGSYASIQAPPWSVTREQWSNVVSFFEQGWGQGVGVPINAPSRANDEPFVQWFARLERASDSPGGIAALMWANFDIDVRHVLPAISAPTLILHCVGDRTVPVAAGRDIASRIAGARYVELPGEDHMLQAYPRDVLNRLIEEIEVFVTGARSDPEPDRALVSLLFVDITGSTEQAVRAGDRRWRELLDGYLSAARRQLVRFRGREVDNAGDGVFAVFDGPARAIRCACAIRDGVAQLGLELHAGVHIGECEVAGDKVRGVAVHTAARVAAAAGAGEVLVSGTVRDLVAGSGIRFEERGTHELKGVPGRWPLLAVVSS
jgi:pimeloyl-ACP methyl ester carboxylesterase